METEALDRSFNPSMKSDRRIWLRNVMVLSVMGEENRLGREPRGEGGTAECFDIRPRRDREIGDAGPRPGRVRSRRRRTTSGEVPEPPEHLDGPVEVRERRLGDPALGLPL